MQSLVKELFGEDRTYGSLTKEELRLYKREYNRRNPEVSIDSRRRFIEKLGGREGYNSYSRCYQRVWREKNRNKLREYYRRYREKNRDKIAVYNRRYRESVVGGGGGGE